MGSCRLGVHGQRPKHPGDVVEPLTLLASLPCNTIECSAVIAEKGCISRAVLTASTSNAAFQLNVLDPRSHEHGCIDRCTRLPATAKDHQQLGCELTMHVMVHV